MGKTVSNHNFDLTWDTVFNWGDPVIGVHRTYQTSNIKKGVIWSNTQQYSNPKVDAIMEKAGVENDMVSEKLYIQSFRKCWQTTCLYIGQILFLIIPFTVIRLAILLWEFGQQVLQWI